MLTSLIATLTGWFAPWQALYSDSKVIETVVTSTHLVAILIGGGLAIAADRDTLRVTRVLSGIGPEVLERLNRTHRPVLIALLVLFVSGLALATADIPTFSKSLAFLVKLSLVTLLLINGAVLVDTERRLGRSAPGRATQGLWRRLRVVSRLSLALWTCTVIAGAALANSG